MLWDSSQNALTAKAKAKYGNRIDENVFKELVNSRSISELTEYLKHNTYYGDVLEDVNERTIHRKQLETLIRKDGYTDIFQVQRFIGGDRKTFYSFYTIQLEIVQITNCLRYMSSKSIKEFLIDLPLFINKYIRFDLNAMAAVESYEDLLQVVHHTPYYNILMAFKPAPGHRIDYSAIENALDEFYYDDVFRRIKKQFKGRERTQLLSIFQTSLELRNVSIVYRYKKYFDASPKEIVDKLYLKGQRISYETWYQFASSKSAEGFLEMLSQSRYRFYQDDDRNVFIEYSTDSIRFHLAKKLIHFSNYASVVFASFIITKEIEVNNVVSVIEGIRYGVVADSIYKMLIM